MNVFHCSPHIKKFFIIWRIAAIAFMNIFVNISSMDEEWIM